MKYKYPLAAGVVFTLVLGAYLDSKNKLYEHEIVVLPNSNSAFYTKVRVAHLAAVIQEKDTLSLQKMGFSAPKKWLKLSYKPIVDAFPYLEKNEQRMQLFKILAETGDAKKIIEEEAISKNYKYHSIKLLTKDKVSTKSIVEPLKKYLNANVFLQKINQNNWASLHIKQKANAAMIAQIDALLAQFSSQMRVAKPQNMLYYNENTQLNDLIKTKNELLYEQIRLAEELIEQKDLISFHSVLLNTPFKIPVWQKRVVVFPFLGLLLLVFFIQIKGLYQKRRTKG